MAIGDYGDYDFSSYSSSGYGYKTQIDDTTLNIFGGIFLVMWALCLVIGILCIVAYWKIFTKAGEQGWKSIIPFYNIYVLFSISWEVKYFLYFIGIYIVSILICLIPFIGWAIAIVGSIAAETFKKNLAKYINSDTKVFSELEDVIFKRV